MVCMGSSTKAAGAAVLTLVETLLAAQPLLALVQEKVSTDLGQYVYIISIYCFVLNCTYIVLHDILSPIDISIRESIANLLLGLIDS